MLIKRTKNNPKLYRYRDLKAGEVVPNRVTLSRWIKAGLFPAPIQLGPNSIAWIAEEVDSHLAALAAARK